MIEKIEWNGKVFALILRSNSEPEATTFFTSKEDSLQLGIIKHEKGYTEKPHIHKHFKKLIYDVQETLHVEYGKVQFNFYNEEGENVRSAVLDKGDTILLIDGGHAIYAIEGFKGIKVKQGPYVSIEDDKVFLETLE